MANGTTQQDDSGQKPDGSSIDDQATGSATASDTGDQPSGDTSDLSTTGSSDLLAVASDVDPVITLLAGEAGVADNTGTGLSTDTAGEGMASTAGAPVGQQPSATPTSGPDELVGTSGSDSIDGLAGNDTILGLGSNDTLAGGADADRLFGGPGGDSLDGGDGTDLLEGGAQGDTFFGGSDPARDLVSYAHSNSAVSIDLLNGTASGGHAQGDSLTNVNDLRGSNFNDTLIGDNSDNLIEGGRGGDELVGREGDLDLVSYVSSSDPVQIDLGSGQATGGDADGDVILGFEGVVGSRFDDELRTSDAGQWVVGGAGGDEIIGGEGLDTLIGGTGDDRISGGGEYDQLFGGAGTDTLTAGGGDDDFIFDPADFAATPEDADHITDYDGGANQWIRIIGGTWSLTDITQANSTGYSFDQTTGTIFAPGGTDVVAILDNWTGGPVLLETWA